MNDRRTFLAQALALVPASLITLSAQCVEVRSPFEALELNQPAQDGTSSHLL